MEIVKLYLSEFLGLLNEMSPYLLLGFFFAGLLHVLMPTEKVVKYLGGKNLKSVANASILGVPLPLCSCGVIPTGLSFYKNGASKGSTVSFLISTPQTGVDSIFVTYSLLGLPLAILRPVIAFITGIVGGVITNSITKNEAKEAESFFSKPETVSVSKQNVFVEMFRYAFVDFMQDIAKWLIIGLVAAAFISVLIPDNFFTTYMSNDYLSMLLVLAASVPMYVCATGSVPIAAVLMMKGLSPGAAIVFLMAGPATNAATIAMVGRAMGRKSLIAYLVSIIGGAIISGILVNEFLPREWMMMNMNHHAHHNHEEMLPMWFQVSSTITLALLMANAMRLRYFKKEKSCGCGGECVTDNESQTKDTMQTKTVSVEGMTCNHCKANVENNLRKLPGVTDVTVDLQAAQATIVAETMDLDLIKSTVDGLGYKYRGEK